MSKTIHSLRKGARAIVVDGRPFSWFRGRSVVELRDRATNRAVHVPHAEVSEPRLHCWCGDVGCGHAEEIGVVVPGAVAKAIRRRFAI